MTRSTLKPKRHPTFTISELREIRSALISRGEEITKRNELASVSLKDALTKVSNAIVYRENLEPRSKNEQRARQEN